MQEGIVGRVEDAVAGGCGWEEYAGGRELLEVADVRLLKIDTKGRAWIQLGLTVPACRGRLPEV